MRRFGFMIFALALLTALIGERRDGADGLSEDQSASSNSEGMKPTEKPANVEAERSPGTGKQSAASERSGAADGVLKTAAIIEDPARVGQAQDSGHITSSPAHVQASAKAGGIDPALEGISQVDLASAAQGELKRLGCYSGKIDGKWGRKSEAAAAEFGERVGGDWTGASRRDLVTALRNYPKDFCTTECASTTPNGQCTAEQAPASAKTEDRPSLSSDTSYLPPWMQGTKLSNAEPSAISASDAQKTLSDAAPGAPKPKKRKSVRRGRESQRFVSGYERRSGGNRNWAPRGWPGSRD